jgi:hypothetical protein
MEKLTKPIIIGAVVIGLCILCSQILKQSSIERQQQAELLAEEQRVEKEERLENLRKLELSICLDTAEEDYWSYMRINGEEDDDEVIWASDKYWNTAEKNKQNDIDNCYKQYK